MFLIILGSTSALAQQPLPSLVDAKANLSTTMTLNNGLKVIIVSDSKTSASSASITVGAGQRSTPNEYEGIPHLLEHALFLGSEKYPEKQSWDNFIKGNGGWSNGSTRSSNTRYHFQIDNEYFEQGLTRFYDMVFHPTLSNNAIEISLSEVNEEFESSKKSDWQGILSVIRQNTSETNSASYFGKGNLLSLGSDTAKLRAAAIAFHQRHYVPNNMALAIYTNVPAEVIKKAVISTFETASIKQSASLNDQNNLNTPEKLGSVISIESHSNRSSLDVRFEVPVSQLKNNRHVAKYVAHLLGHEAPGSIFYQLKSDGLANSLSVAFQGDDINEVLDIYVDLTNKGVESHKQVLASVFGYIKMLQKNTHPEYLQSELLMMAKREMGKSQSTEAGDWASDLSDTALVYGLDDAITATTDFKPISERDINQYLSFIAPSNMQAYLSSNKVNEVEHYTEYYKRGYTVYSLKNNELQQLKVSTTERFKLPTKNKYLSAVSANDKVNKTKAHIVENTALKSEDAILARLSFGVINNHVKVKAISHILAKRFQDGLGDEDYFASLSGYRIEPVQHHDALGVIFSGNEDNLYRYSHDLINKALSTLSKEEFTKLKARAAYSYEDILFDRDYKLAVEESNNALLDLPSVTTMLDVIKQVEFAEYSTLIDSVKNNLSIYLPKNKKGVSVYFVQHSNGLKPTTPSPVSGGDIVIGRGKKDKSIAYTITANTNSLSGEASLRVLNVLTVDKYHDLMRQEKKVAYIVGSRINKATSPSLSYIVESSTLGSDELVSLTKDFLIGQRASKFDAISAEKFEKAKSVALQKARTKRSLKETSHQLSLGYISLDYDDLLESEIRNLSIEDVLDSLGKI
nr:hypothetical protein BCU55_16570 [Shewanella sp. 10N.286.48.A6]